MKTLHQYLILAVLLVASTACEKEGTPVPAFKYPGPNPAIAEGPSEAQKICYELYQKYDLHTYYTLSNEDALITTVGKIQTNGIGATDPFTMPAGDEATAEVFLKLLKNFYALLPEDLVKSSVLRRNVLIKVNAQYSSFEEYYSTAYTEEQQGIVYWGEIDDEIGIQPEVWKYSLFYTWFRAQTNPYHNKKCPLATDFGKISKGFYAGEQDDYYGALESIYDIETGELDMDLLMNWGFVSPVGFAEGDSQNVQNADMTDFAYWIVSIPIEDRREILDNYSLIKQKYDLTLKYFKTYLNIDLEALGKQWQQLEIEEIN